MKICSENQCTMCGLCKKVCPKQCVEEKTEKDGYSYMVADDEKCIDCGLCKKLCHVENKSDLNSPKTSYAAWAKDVKLHNTAASGGVASLFYSYALKNGYYIVGTEWTDNFCINLKLTNDEADIEEFKNSKYTFSDPSGVFGDIVKLWKEGKRVLFIGLPCQVSAIQKLADFHHCEEYLITADLVCHGTPPKNYLPQHIKSISGNKKVDKCYFRDPKYGTEYYAFTLYSGEKLIYKKEVRQDDLYNWGYHNSAIYRRNCYTCLYAKNERPGDLTLGDYHGLGKHEAYSGPKKQISCIVVNTEKGKTFLKSVVDDGVLNIVKRPTDEPIAHDPQFHHSSVAPAERDVFLKEYEKYGDFGAASRKAFLKKARKNLKGYYVFAARRAVKKIIPKSLAQKLKKLI